MTSFLTSLLSAITRPWRRPAEPSERDLFAALDLHPDDLPRFEAAFASRQPFEMEYRQRYDGEELRWMLSRSVALEAHATSAPLLEGLQILLVDPEAKTAELVATVLRQHGAQVTIARSAAEAILALYQHHDLVVTDHAVPVTEGVMLAQQLRQANFGLPAIVLRKPVDGAALASEIAQVLTRSGEA